MRALLAVATLLLALPAAAQDVDAPDFDSLALARLAAPPLGLPPLALAAGEAPSAAMIALGRKLFFDRRLSHNATMSCGICHVPEQGFTNNELKTPLGVEGRSLRRNAPTILNVAYQQRLFHDGRETALETQVISPLLARNEMANPSIGYLVQRIANLPDYAGRFEAAFGAGPSIGRIGAAIAAWERSLLAARSPFDRWRYGGEAAALSGRQRQGFDLFTGRAGCANCHSVGARWALFTDQAFHDTGIGWYRATIAAADESPVTVEIAPGVTTRLDRAAVRAVGNPPEPDLGRHEVTRDPADFWKVKTPGLRNVALTAPYMHDGSLGSLEAVVRFYAAGGHPHDGLDPLIRPLELDEPEVAALVAFLESLTSPDIADLVADARSVPVGN